MKQYRYCLLLVFCTSCRLFSPNEPTEPQSPSVAWKTKIIENVLIDYSFPLARWNNIVVCMGQAGENKQRLLGLDATTGEVRWMWEDFFEYGQPSGLVFSLEWHQLGEILLFVSGGKQYCVDISTGKTLWRRYREYSSRGGVCGNGYQYAIVGTTFDNTGEMYDNIYVGDIRDPEIERCIYKGTPGRALGRPYLYRDANGTLRILFLEVIRSTGTTDYSYTTYIVGFDLTSDREIYRTMVYSQTKDGGGAITKVYGDNCYSVVGRRMVCTGLGTGKIRWFQNFPGDFLFSGFIIVDGTIYANCEDTYLYALDAETGLIKWREKSSGTSSPLFYMDGVLYYVGGGDGMLHAVDAATGKHLWKIDPPERNDYGFTRSRPTGFDGRLYVTSWTTAYCYRVR
jgi:outer membrane protein assembly factor BamB